MCLGSVLYELFTLLSGLATRPREGLSDLLCASRAASQMKQLKACPISDRSRCILKVSGTAPRTKTKAVRARYLFLVVAHIIEHFYPPKNLRKDGRLPCAQQMSASYAVLEALETGFSGGRVARFGRAHGCLYGELAKSTRAASC